MAWNANKIEKIGRQKNRKFTSYIFFEKNYKFWEKLFSSGNGLKHKVTWQKFGDQKNLEKLQVIFFSKNFTSFFREKLF